MGNHRNLVVAIAVAFNVGLAAAPAPASADPAPPQIQGPAGKHLGEKPRGWVLVVHGGGWNGVGEGAMSTIKPAADWLNRAGWSTMSVDYDPGAASQPDVRAAYDGLRRRVGSKMPICLTGQSAGAQLVLMLAAARPKISCVIAEGAPIDLPAFAHSAAYDAVSGLLQTVGPLKALSLAVSAFGADNLLSHSPIAVARRIHMPVLLATSAEDPLIPSGQLAEFAKAVPSARTMLLDGGPEPFIHAGISSAALVAYNHAKRVILKQARG